MRIGAFCGANCRCERGAASSWRRNVFPSHRSVGGDNYDFICISRRQSLQSAAREQKGRRLKVGREKESGEN